MIGNSLTSKILLMGRDMDLVSIVAKK